MADTQKIAELTPLQQLNFLLTNRLPRRWLTLLMGRISRIHSPLLAKIMISIWRLFVDDLRLTESKQSHFNSLHECFIRELKPGARPLDLDPEILVSPCDAVIGAFGNLQAEQLIQAKGFPYSLDELLGDPSHSRLYRNGRFVTLRLKSSMYHRFHAPMSACTQAIQYISGDTWNVNPIALKVVDKLFCKNERVIIKLTTDRGPITLVAVAAILVASVRLHGLRQPLNLRYRGANHISYHRELCKGEEIGYFEHGSTILVFSTKKFQFTESIMTGHTIRMGEPLMQCTAN